MLKLMILLIMSLTSSFVFAENTRHIHLNQEHLESPDIAILDQLFGQTVADGEYWINLQTGQWGYEGEDEVYGVLDEVLRWAQTRQQNNYGSGKPEIDISQNGSVVSGQLNGQNCTFASAGGMTFKSVIKNI